MAWFPDNKLEQFCGAMPLTLQLSTVVVVVDARKLKVLKVEVKEVKVEELAVKLVKLVEVEVVV